MPINYATCMGTDVSMEDQQPPLLPLLSRGVRKAPDTYSDVSSSLDTPSSAQQHLLQLEGRGLRVQADGEMEGDGLGGEEGEGEEARARVSKLSPVKRPRSQSHDQASLSASSANDVVVDSDPEQSIQVRSQSHLVHLSIVITTGSVVTVKL